MRDGGEISPFGLGMDLATPIVFAARLRSPIIAQLSSALPG